MIYVVGLINNTEDYSSFELIGVSTDLSKAHNMASDYRISYNNNITLEGPFAVIHSKVLDNIDMSLDDNSIIIIECQDGIIINPKR